MIEQIKCQIKNYILGSLITDTELFTVFQIFNIPIDNTRDPQLKRLTIEAISRCNDINLLQQIYYIFFKCNMSAQSSYNPNSSRCNNINRAPSNHNGNFRVQPRHPIYNVNLYCFTYESLAKCPIDIQSEIKSDVNSRQLFSPSFSKISEANIVRVPNHNQIMSGTKLINKISELPCICWNTVVDSAPFYCSQIILHPLSIMVPKVFPDTSNTGRIMSKMSIYFTLTKSVQNLIRHHQTIAGKMHFKWQVVVRFGVYDCTKPFPDVNAAQSELPECLPPYLSVEINNKPIQLGDILPSNSITKEGKRHPRPLNITEYLNFDNQIEQTRQYLSLSWWQTPGVYNYYYFGVFVERKISVNEYITKFRQKTNAVRRPLSCTLDLIKRKFSSNKNDVNDDDIVISSVLPISLQCPVGRSRITLPLRSIHCDHLQCFDGCLFIQMNERRAAWRCPVCDNSAKIDELFVDEYFQHILERYQKNEDVTEVNIHSDTSFQPVIYREKEEKRNDRDSKIKNISNTDTVKDDAPVVLLESDDENEDIPINENNIIVKKDVEYLPPVDNYNNNQPENFMIDLTSDNDEEPNLDNGMDTEERLPISTNNLTMANNASTSTMNQSPTLSLVNSICPPLESYLTTSVRNVLDRYPSVATTSVPNINFNTHPNSSTSSIIPASVRQTLPSTVSDSFNPAHYPHSTSIRNIYPRIQPNQNNIQHHFHTQNPLLRHHLIHPSVPTRTSSNCRTISQNPVHLNQILQRHHSAVNSNSNIHMNSTTLLSAQPSFTVNSHVNNSVSHHSRKQILKPLLPSARSSLLPSTSVMSNCSQNLNGRFLRQQTPSLTQHKLAKKPIPNLKSVSKSNLISNDSSNKRSVSDKHEPRLQVLVIKKSKNNPSEYTLDRRRSNRLSSKNRRISYKEQIESSEDDDCSHISSHSSEEEEEVESLPDTDSDNSDFSVNKHGKRRKRIKCISSSDDDSDSYKRSKGNDSDQPERTHSTNEVENAKCNIKNAANNLQSSSYPIVCLSRLDMNTIQSMISKPDCQPSLEKSLPGENNESNENNNILESKMNQG